MLGETGAGREPAITWGRVDRREEGVGVGERERGEERERERETRGVRKGIGSF